MAGVAFKAHPVSANERKELATLNATLKRAGLK
jgi:hypothetical protein